MNLETFFKKLFSFLSFFLAVVGLHRYAGFSSVEESRGYPLVAVCRLLIAVASFVAEHGL